MPVDALGPVWQDWATMNESEKQFSFTRAASSTSGRARSKFLSGRLPKTFAPAALNRQIARVLLPSLLLLLLNSGCKSVSRSHLMRDPQFCALVAHLTEAEAVARVQSALEYTKLALERRPGEIEFFELGWGAQGAALEIRNHLDRMGTGWVCFADRSGAGIASYGFGYRSTGERSMISVTRTRCMAVGFADVKSLHHGFNCYELFTYKVGAFSFYKYGLSNEKKRDLLAALCYLCPNAK